MIPPKAQKVLDALDGLAIRYELLEHPPLNTIEEAMPYWKDVEAAPCKNLFFRNHKGNKHFLVVLAGHRQLAIRELEALLRQGKISFASPERLERHLGLMPGSVSPFGLLNDGGRHVALFIDSELREAERLCFHPNVNTLSLIVAQSDFHRFLEHWGGERHFLKLT